jgi:hypothetical protein
MTQKIWEKNGALIASPSLNGIDPFLARTSQNFYDVCFLEIASSQSIKNIPI